MAAPAPFLLGAAHEEEKRIMGKLFEGWTWQKWVGKLAPIVTGLLAVGVWEFAELPAQTWAGVAAGIITFLAQQIVALFPPKS